jgi:hypothetical protein
MIKRRLLSGASVIILTLVIQRREVTRILVFVSDTYISDYISSCTKNLSDRHKVVIEIQECIEDFLCGGEHNRDTQRSALCRLSSLFHTRMWQEIDMYDVNITNRAKASIERSSLEYARLILNWAGTRREEFELVRIQEVVVRRAYSLFVMATTDEIRHFASIQRYQ